MAAKGQHSTCRKWDLLSVCGIVKHLGLWPTGIMALGLQTRLSQMGPQPQYSGRKTGQPGLQIHGLVPGSRCICPWTRQMVLPETLYLAPQGTKNCGWAPHPSTLFLQGTSKEAVPSP